jgi:hypothetical protein
MGTPGHIGRTGRMADGEAGVAMATVLVVEDERKLQSKIEDDPGDPRVVQTVVGGG